LAHWVTTILESFLSSESPIPSKETIMNRFTLSRRQTGTKRPAQARPVVELLEDRTVLSSYTAATVADLIADINAANLAGGSNTITLAAGKSFGLTQADNTMSGDGANGLPVIAANNNLTIIGNGDTIARSSAKGTPAFRLFDVAPSASLTLENLTLEGGLADSSSGSVITARGGAIFNQGALTLSAVTVTGNSAVGTTGTSWGTVYIVASAMGGGIYSSGSLTLAAGTLITNNSALGFTPKGQHATIPIGGDGYGGGVYIAGGTAALTNVTLSSNTAAGGNASATGSAGGQAAGGALYGGIVTLTGCTLTSNVARGGNGKAWGGEPTGARWTFGPPH
jgi:hypothetical protein